MAKEPAKKTKRPTAQKRMLQNEKKRMVNKNFNSKVKTAIRGLNESVEKKEDSTEKLNTAFSLIDKAVKRGIYKENKGSRTKARLAAKVSA